MRKYLGLEDVNNAICYLLHNGYTLEDIAVVLQSETENIDDSLAGMGM